MIKNKVLLFKKNLILKIKKLIYYQAGLYIFKDKIEN